jgi:hypothetical protein
MCIASDIELLDKYQLIKDGTVELTSIDAILDSFRSHSGHFPVPKVFLHSRIDGVFRDGCAGWAEVGLWSEAGCERLADPTMHGCWRQ